MSDDNIIRLPQPNPGFVDVIQNAPEFGQTDAPKAIPFVEFHAVQKTCEGFRAALTDIARVCEARAYPGGPVVISELHLADMQQVAAAARAALKAQTP